MSTRARRWVIGLAVLDAVTLALTIHANLTFHRTANSPSVMTIGQALGWIIFGVLFVMILLIIKESRR